MAHLITAGFVVWDRRCRRAEVLCDFMNAKCLFVDDLIKSRGGMRILFFWINYLYKTIITLVFLFKYKPRIVFAQSPPSFCPMICWLYCRFFKGKLVVDAHNSAFEKLWISVPLYVSVLEAAQVVVVHNDEFEDYLKGKFDNVTLITLPDKIPMIEGHGGRSCRSRNRYFLAVVSYSYDEPILEMLEAAKQFVGDTQSDIAFKITGDYNKRPDIYNKYSKVRGIEFLGFVDNDAYDDLLKGAYGIISLTTRHRLQQCGSVEAMGANVPLIVSDSATNRRLFFKGAIVTKVDIASIKHAIYEFCSQREKLSSEIEVVRNHWEKMWKLNYAELVRLMRE